MDPEAILAGLNEEQRAAATATTGPVVILAGAGTGKTRVISHRVAYAAATGIIDPRTALIVTFTEKAAGEMKHRLTALGLPQVQASTFHAAARRQLAHFWPITHGEPLPDVLDSKLRIIGPMARSLPGGYRFTPAKDLADEIEWAKVRRQTPDTYAPGHEPPVPADVFTTLWRRYEQAKQRASRIDFEDMLTLAVELYETDAGALALAHRRYRWFSVDEYQDTNRLQEDLLRLWLGDRRDLCVVGDPDQTIYSFTGASSDYLLTFTDRYEEARVVRLSQNYRSSPQVISLANRLIPGRELRSTAADGPEPELRAFADGEAEIATIVARITALEVPQSEIAILVRTNAQLVGLEAALTEAEIPFTVRGVRFYARPEVRAAIRALRPDATGRLARIVSTRWRTELGFDEAHPPGPGAEARDRHAALGTLLAIARQLEAAQPAATVADYVAELDRRADAEAAAEGDGVTLSTLHRAKGLEWDAVFLPQLEEGTLPIRQSSDGAALAEERRLLYVGITRARRHLLLSWAASRIGSKGTSVRARPSRFVSELRPGAVARPVPKPGRSGTPATFDLSPADEPLLAALIEWRRERARADGVPAYVVADNKTLAAIAVRRPVDAGGLLGVPGIGQRKVAAYGEEILGIVRSA